MRCGQRKTIFKDQNGIMYKLYGSKAEVSERHRHRYEVNPEHVKEISSKGLKFVGEDVDGERMEIIELEGHPFFVGLQVCLEQLDQTPFDISIIIYHMISYIFRLIRSSHLAH